ADQRETAVLPRVPEPGGTDDDRRRPLRRRPRQARLRSAEGRLGRGPEHQRPLHAEGDRGRERAAGRRASRCCRRSGGGGGIHAEHGGGAEAGRVRHPHLHLRRPAALGSGPTGFPGTRPRRVTRPECSTKAPAIPISMERIDFERPVRGGSGKMSIFGCEAFDGHEQMVFCCDRDTGLQAIIAIHDTTLGPALGGCRFWPYPDEAQALEDVLRLSRGMTYKAAMARLPLGGGKSVILGDPQRTKSRELLLAFGEAVARLGGRYIVAEDVGTSAEDMAIVRRMTRHVAGLSGAGGAGDPGPTTALGVLYGIRAAVRHKLGRRSLKGCSVAVQGLGSVGCRLCQLLHGEGACLTVADIDRSRVERAVKELSATPSEPEAIIEVESDV